MISGNGCAGWEFSEGNVHSGIVDSVVLLVEGEAGIHGKEKEQLQKTVVKLINVNAIKTYLSFFNISAAEFIIALSLLSEKPLGIRFGGYPVGGSPLPNVVSSVLKEAIKPISTACFAFAIVLFT